MPYSSHIIETIESDISAHAHSETYTVSEGFEHPSISHVHNQSYEQGQLPNEEQSKFSSQR